MPSISIVLPTYNGEKYIRESIDSILSQTFDDWELLIVNDCSTDGTYEIINEYAKHDERIRVINNDKNQGLPIALNIGFRNACGEYLTWTSDDNMYLSSALATMKYYLDNNKDYPMVCTGMLCVDQDKRIISEHVKYKEEEMYLNDMVGASFLYRREVLDEIGEYDEGLFCSEDYDYWVRILRRYGKIGFIDCVEYIYRYQPGSLTVTRIEEVRRKNRILYYKHFEWIYGGIKNEPAKVYRLYNELIAEPLYADSNEVKRIKTDYKALSFENAIRMDADVIFFGAGSFGRRALDYVKHRPLYFVDNNSFMIGKNIDGIEVISFDKMISYLEENRDCNIVITARFEKQASMIEQLLKCGINSYTLYSRLCGDKIW